MLFVGEKYLTNVKKNESAVYHVRFYVTNYRQCAINGKIKKPCTLPKLDVSTRAGLYYFTLVTTTSSHTIYYLSMLTDAS